MKTYKYLILIWTLGMSIILFSCINDLDTIPLDKKELVSEVVYGSDIEAYQQSLAKIYAGLAISGNSGGDGDPDVDGVDGGSQASFLRGLWNLQELPTDEAHCCWGDVGIPELNEIRWGAGNVFIKGFYYRLYYQINLANAFLRETTNDKLNDRGVNDANKSIIKEYRAEARFHRALSYFYLLDMFRNVPFVTEASPLGKDAPEQKDAKVIFDYIESELINCSEDLLEPFVGFNSKDYGRAHKAAAWALLSRLYLNANVYIVEDKYTESIIYSKKVLDIAYELESDYKNNFVADNQYSTEMIFPIRYEGDETQTWGGMTFLMASTVPSDLQDDINTVGAWQGNRARSSLLEFFQNQNNFMQDSRYSMVCIDNTTNIEIENPTLFNNNGTPIVKYFNVNKDGSLPPSNIVYTDFPLFRLGEIYLNYAEAIVRGGSGGTIQEALKLINDLRSRAYHEGLYSPISESALTLDFLFEERGREFFFEGQRRTDMIRFGKFTGSSYIWPWKGGVAEGKSVESYFNVYPIPSDDLGANPSLVQNEGYGSSTED